MTTANVVVFLIMRWANLTPSGGVLRYNFARDLGGR